MAELATGVAAGNEGMAAAWDGSEGDDWAADADRYEATGVAYVAAMLAAAGLGRGSAVLDVGCGTGKTTLDAARIARDGVVLGVDLSSKMLAVGRARAAADGLDNVRFEQVDAQVHPFDPSSFDVAISSFGAMFFADPVAAFANIGRALRPGGQVVLLAWRDLDRNEWVSSIRSALAAGRDLPVPPPGAQGPFSMADRDLTAARLTEAGFADVRFESIDEPMYLGRDTDDAYAFVSTFGITRGLTDGLDDTARADVLDRLRESLAAHATPNGVTYGGSAWLVTARRAAGAPRVGS